MLSKIDDKELSDSSSTSSTLLAWCSRETSLISVIDLETKQDYANFDGTSISDTYESLTHLKEIPNTKLLVSLHHNYSYDYKGSANMEIFDISKKGKANKIYSLGEVSGGIGPADVTYNCRRSILGAIPLFGSIAYHLFAIDANGIVKLSRKSKWHSQYSTKEDNYITGFDFNPTGESIGTIDRYKVCLVSDVNTNNYVFHLELENSTYLGRDDVSRCRWSTNTGEPLLFVKYGHTELNILDVQKKALIWRNPVDLDLYAWGICCIDVSQSNGNLLASGGVDGIINIFDKRESRIVKTFEGVHSWTINCVRWNPSGDMIASASDDKTAKLLDFKTGKVLHTGTTSDGEPAISVCFI